MQRKEEPFFFILKAKIFCRELDRIVGVIGFRIYFQALCLGIIGRFNLNGDKSAVTLDDKINLGAPRGFPIAGGIPINGKLYIDTVFRHTAFKVVDSFHHIENIVCG